LLHDAASPHHDHLVIVRDGVESVGYRDDGRLGKFLANYTLNKGISPHIDVGCRLVKHQKFISLQQCPSQTKQLSLTNRKTRRDVFNVGVEGMLKCPNVFAEARLLKDLP
jgi:hypothetical protein